MTATYTTNLALAKPDPGVPGDPTQPGDPADVSVINANMDALDVAIGAKTVKAVAQSLANTTTETVIHTLTVPANKAAVSSVYKIVVWATAVMTATPTITLRFRLGGVAGSLLGTIVFNVNNTGEGFRAEAEVVIKAIGSGTTAKAHGVISGVSFLPTTQKADVDMSVSETSWDSTASTDFVVTAQWSAASASNVLTVQGGYAYRITNA
jgi:hypothetical protein